MNAKRGVIVATAVATVFLVAMVGAVSAHCNQTANPNCHGCCYVNSSNGCIWCYECGDTVTQSCTFDGNLTCPCTSWGLKIGADGITIDGAGYKITGSVNAPNCNCNITYVSVENTSSAYPAKHSGIINYGSPGKNNTVIKNLEIENFCTGIGLRRADYTTVIDCKIHDNGKTGALGSCTHGIHMSETNHCKIERNSIYNNTGTGTGCTAGGDGIFMYGEAGPGKNWGDWNTIKQNHLYNNRWSGLLARHKCMHNTVEYNNASGNGFGGIVPLCKMSKYWTIRYNVISNNNMFGLKTQGSYNTIECNTIINNDKIGLEIVSSAGPPPPGGHGKNNTVTNNTICGHTVKDIKTTAGNWGNIFDENTCDTPGACDWNCNNLISTYYDYDGDGYYSKDPAGCTCNNTLDVGSCCNPGLFNASGAGTHCANCDCIYPGPGTDPNDCDDSILGTPINWYCDDDGDGYISSTPSGSGAPGGMPPGCQLTPGDDCDDTKPNVNPGATEDCYDGIDNDCDGLIDGNDPDCVVPTPTPTPPPEEVPAITPLGFLLALISLFGLAAVAMRKMYKR